MKIYINWASETYTFDKEDICAQVIETDDIMFEEILDEYLGNDYDIALVNFRRLAGNSYDEWVENIQYDPRFIEYQNAWLDEWIDDNYDVHFIDEDEEYYILWDDTTIGTFDELTKGCPDDIKEYIIKNMKKVEVN